MHLDRHIIVRQEHRAQASAKHFEIVEAGVSFGEMAITMIPFRVGLRTANREYVVSERNNAYILVDAQTPETRLASARQGSLCRERTLYGFTKDVRFQFGPAWMFGSRLNLSVDQQVHGTFVVRIELFSVSIRVELAQSVDTPLVGYFSALSLFDAWRHSTG